jgi:hypothetical protein
VALTRSRLSDRQQALFDARKKPASGRSRAGGRNPRADAIWRRCRRGCRRRAFRTPRSDPSFCTASR